MDIGRILAETGLMALTRLKDAMPACVAWTRDLLSVEDLVGHLA